MIRLPNIESDEHADRVGLIASIIANRIGLIGISNELREAAKYHDIGKIFIPKAILYKPGKLTYEEFKIMQQHTILGAKYIEKTDLKNKCPRAATIAEFHHERWNGAGYPYHLEGSQIPIEAQISGMADCIDALCSKRPYKEALPIDIAVDMIRAHQCGIFSPDLTDYINSKQSLYDIANLTPSHLLTHKAASSE